MSEIFLSKNQRKTRSVDPYALRLFFDFYQKDEAHLNINSTNTINLFFGI